jgi:Asp/Glu/hydantoin racemase
MALEHPSNAVVLGCAGMTNIWNKLQPDHQITLIDPVAATAKLIPVLV